MSRGAEEQEKRSVVPLGNNEKEKEKGKEKE